MQWYEHESKEDAAKALHALIVKECASVGQKPEIETACMHPEQSESCGYGKNWAVFWEAGPHDWGVALSLHGTPFDNRITYNGGNGWYLETYYGFDVLFCDA